MKLIKKSDCSFVSGMIIAADGETVLQLPPVVANLLHQLDIKWQMHQYLSEQEPFCPAPTMDGFYYEKWSDVDRGWSYPNLPETPETDERVMKTMAYIRESEKSNIHARLVDKINVFQPLLDFCSNDWFLSTDANHVDPVIQCSRIGNPLELSADDVITMLSCIVEDEYCGQDDDE